MPAERIDKTNCFKMNEIDQTLFYQMPKLLFSNPLYFPLTNNARVVYSLLRDRMDLSRKNGWCEDDGTIYLLFPLDKIAEIAKISHKTCVNVMKELKKYDLVITRRMGLGKPNRVYIKKCKNYTSYGVKNTLQEVEKIHPNDTDISDTEIIETKTNRKGGSKKTIEAVINDFVGNNEELREAVEGFIEMRKAIKKPLTVRALAMGLKNLKKRSGDDESLMIKICDQSTVNCWQGFYELKPEKSAEQIKAEIERKKKEEERQRMIAEITF